MKANINYAIEARKLANYAKSLTAFQEFEEPKKDFVYCHIGALFTDISLQSGLNYKTVVKPRVQKILVEYPDANTVQTFETLIDKINLCDIISWKHPEKINRIKCLIEFSKIHNINSHIELREFLLKDDNHKLFLSLKGFGPKTFDYLLKLLNVDAIAVDRHIYAFLRKAQIEVCGYIETKKIVEFAADFLNISRTSIDKFIWEIMSSKVYKPVKLATFNSIEDLV